MEAKNKSNPYPKVLMDEVSGIEVPDIRHQLWEEGHKAGIREVVEWVNSNIPDSLEVWANLKTNILIKGDKWQAKLKEWFKDNPELLKKWGINNE